MTYDIRDDLVAPAVRDQTPDKYGLGRLQVGWSVFIPAPSVAQERTVRSTVARYKRVFDHPANPWSYTARKWVENGVSGIRVWRVA